MKKSKIKPVLNYTEFLNEDAKMNIKNSSDMNNWDPKSELNDKDIPKVNAPNSATPLLNLLSEYSYSIIDIQPGGNKNKFGVGCEEIKIGDDLNKRMVYLITIAKLWTKEMLQDSYGEDCFEDENKEEVTELLGTVFDENDDDSIIRYNFFTDFTNITAPAFKEAALKYAQQFYKIYKELDIHVDGYTEFFGEDESKIIQYLNRTGVNIKSNSDIPQFIRVGYRVYQDSKVMYKADEEFFDDDFIHKFINL